MGSGPHWVVSGMVSGQLGSFGSVGWTGGFGSVGWFRMFHLLVLMTAMLGANLDLGF